MEVFTLVTIGLNLLVSYQGFQQPVFFQRYLFEIGAIRRGEYVRLLSSGYLHGSWTHLLFNMFSFYSFSNSLEHVLGPWRVAIIYFVSLLGGNLLALAIHRRQPTYRAVGASGAVSGIIFAAIALFPGISVGVFLIPIAIPGWIFAILYVLYSMYGMRAQADNVGHEAHLGGAMAGLVAAVALVPQVLTHNGSTVWLVAIPTAIFLVISILRPQGLSFSSGGRGHMTVDDRYNAEKLADQNELDRILEKINHHGMESLTESERKFLDRHAGNG